MKLLLALGAAIFLAPAAVIVFFFLAAYWYSVQGR
jgi:hypothetical protein